MCGIAGWVDWERDLTDERPVLEAMTETLVPRGPDAGGVWLSPRAAFGHRRLKVIDIEGGVQPMQAGRGGEQPCVVTFNGEIYNFRELRNELQGRGHQFRTRSDTEVLLHSYLEWGEKCLSKLNGMFAFAVWDPNRQGLLLGRDRLGVKPLFYLPHAAGVLFGSELKAILAHPIASAEVDAEGLVELLCVNQSPGHAVFRDIRALRPGHYAWIDRRGCRELRYWGLESGGHPDDLPATTEAVRELLEDVVQRQLIADVPVGTLLSGGLDSSAVTALATAARNREGRDRLATYSIDFEGNEENFQPIAIRPEQDNPFARMVAEHVGSDHTELLLGTDEVVKARSEVLRARDIPGLADTNAAQYLLFREVKMRSTVALSGDGADEIFGGYRWFFDERMLNAPTFPWAVSVSGFEPVLDPELWQKLRPHEYIADQHAQTMAEAPALDGEAPADARIRQMFYANLTRWLPLLLDFVDRMSMRVGLEVRVPFCDHRLVEYLWNTPWAFKSTEGRVKSLLRDAVADLLPTAVLDRKKTSFPVSQHPAYEQTLRQQMRAELADSNSPLLPLVRRQAVLDLLEGPLGAQGMWRSADTLSLLLQIAEWVRTYNIRIR
ncbi:asparagine synthase (glutamine-hydrolyzing) [Lentzea rhizosphaerae]|uniref:asparagine synthase (glutamine-hydrolyzing) n=1 Tax=Lentzea rhizosphaerae TaxID=2041025 RepID=A0ABV8BJX8_9PSEU|nr:asparagine synthase (glutamine-hydrolyzing) [Lentzea rhizosphaerae]